MANYPMDIIASKNWKINIPTSGAPEIVQPKLATYTSEWFHLNDAGDGVVFYCPTSGGTTPNSKNPRSELREMRDDGADEAEWNSGSGTHSMVVDLMVTQLPAGSKLHCVIAQIHDSGDDMTVFRLEGSSLWITDGDKTHGHLVTGDYKLGTRIQIGFHINAGVVTYTFNGKTVPYTQTRKRSGCYFKTGAYNQAGGVGDPAGKAEVVLYSVQVCHDGQCFGNAPGVIIVPGEPPPTEPPTTPPANELAQQVAALVQRTTALEHDLASLRAVLRAI